MIGTPIVSVCVRNCIFEWEICISKKSMGWYFVFMVLASIFPNYKIDLRRIQTKLSLMIRSLFKNEGGTILDWKGTRKENNRIGNTVTSGHNTLYFECRGKSRQFFMFEVNLCRSKDLYHPSRTVPTYFRCRHWQFFPLICHFSDRHRFYWRRDLSFLVFHPICCIEIKWLNHEFWSRMDVFFLLINLFRNYQTLLMGICVPFINWSELIRNIGRGSGH